MLIFLLALALRFCNLTASTLWIDEIYSFKVANGHLNGSDFMGVPHSARYFYDHLIAWQPLQWHRLMTLLKTNVHVPLYYCLLNPWLQWIGNNAWGLRSFSAVWSALLVFPMAGLGRLLFPKGSQARWMERTGLLAAFLSAVAPLMIYYGQEGRMYSLSLFFNTLTALSLYSVLHGKAPRRWAAVFAVSLSAGLATHYISVFFIDFLALYTAIYAFQNWRVSCLSVGKRLALLLPGLVVMGFIMYLWHPIYLIQRETLNDEYHFAKSTVRWNRYATALLWQPFITVTGVNPLERLLFIPMILGLVPLAMFRAFKQWQARRQLATQTCPVEEQSETPAGHPYRFLVLWIWTPLVLELVYDLIKHTHMSIIDRYTILIAPGVILLMAQGLSALFQSSRLPVRRFAAGISMACVLFAFLLVASPSPFRDEHNKTKNVRQWVHTIASQAQNKDLVFANGPDGAPGLIAYYLVSEPPKGFPANAFPEASQMPMLYWAQIEKTGNPPLPQTRTLTPYARTWLITLRSNEERGVETVRALLATYYHRHTALQSWLLYGPKPH